ncbi:hypothetical protein GCM10023322_39310 [Rugosimonospora acidiphila]|uniref:Uncharacterized protein n=1 Tax=Rugosimonospora acidiphila TaxID=556531 RepID=A0ABP9RYZ4_9ACTN
MVNTIADNGRGRALAVLVVVAVVGLSLVAGLVLLIVNAARKPAAKANPPAIAGGSATATPGTASSPTADPATGTPQDQQDALAAAPMMSLPESAAQPAPLVTASAGPPIDVPAPTVKPGAGGPPVPTGFPETPEGAIGQLAAIDEAALSTTDVGKAHEVYTWAAMPGAVSEADWTPSAGVTSINQSMGDDAGQAIVVFQAVEGQIKGTVGADFVVACVLGEWDVTQAQLARSGAADCQRMVWSDGRWRIGPGDQPAFPSPVWPGSAESVRAGWRAFNRAA